MKEFSPRLQKIVEVLEQKAQTSAALPARALGLALRFPITLADVEPWVSFGDDNYTRNLIYAGRGWELRLLCFRPGQSTSLHGHGDASCALRVVGGTALEVVLGHPDRVLTTGSVMEESPSVVHQIGALGASPLINLHCYSPPLPIDQPSDVDGHHIAIIGAGFSGVAAAVHLLKLGRPDLRITLFDRRPTLGRGVAYGVNNPIYRLNVPAARMSIDPADPNDFVSWAGVEDSPNDFLSRSRYGAYVEHKLAEAVRSGAGKLRVMRTDVESVEHSGVWLPDGRLLRTQATILATGLSPRMTPKLSDAGGRVIDAWDEAALETLPGRGEVLVLGAGLTALDVLAFLTYRGFSGRITIVSRHGLLPRPHLSPLRKGPGLSPEQIAAAPTDLRGLITWVRSTTATIASSAGAWQLGIDAIRPHTRTLWGRLSAKDRSRFAKKVRPFWEVLRHRAPHDMLQLVEKMKARGELEIVAGSIRSCTPNDRGLHLELLHRDGQVRRRSFDAVVRCIGPTLELSEMNAPLLRDMVSRGLAKLDESELGIVTDANGSLVDASGRPSSRLFALGTLRRASEWEATSVPEIAAQARELARLLLCVPSS
jgi:uncharacterized NAD(P)/FAD-binding protein YdhS/quercetin dioxygenase-like cupin family protein